MARKEKKERGPISPARALERLKEGDEAWASGDAREARRMWRGAHQSGASPEATARLRRALLEEALAAASRADWAPVQEAMSELASMHEGEDAEELSHGHVLALALGGRGERVLASLPEGAGQPAPAGEGSGAAGPSSRIALDGGERGLRGSGFSAAGQPLLRAYALILLERWGKAMAVLGGGGIAPGEAVAAESLRAFAVWKHSGSFQPAGPAASQALLQRYRTGLDVLLAKCRELSEEIGATFAARAKELNNALASQARSLLEDPKAPLDLGEWQRAAELGLANEAARALVKLRDEASGVLLDHVREYRGALEETPEKRAEARLLQGASHLIENRPDQALASLDQVGAGPDRNATWRLLRAVAANRSGAAEGLSGEAPIEEALGWPPAVLAELAASRLTQHPDGGPDPLLDSLERLLSIELPPSLSRALRLSVSSRRLREDRITEAWAALTTAGPAKADVLEVWMRLACLERLESSGASSVSESDWKKWVLDPLREIAARRGDPSAMQADVLLGRALIRCARRAEAGEDTAQAARLYLEALSSREEETRLDAVADLTDLDLPESMVRKVKAALESFADEMTAERLKGRRAVRFTAPPAVAFTPGEIPIEPAPAAVLMEALLLDARERFASRLRSTLERFLAASSPIPIEVRRPEQAAAEAAASTVRPQRPAAGSKTRSREELLALLTPLVMRKTVTHLARLLRASARLRQIRFDRAALAAAIGAFPPRGPEDTDEEAWRHKFFEAVLPAVVTPELRKAAWKAVGEEMAATNTPGAAIADLRALAAAQLLLEVDSKNPADAPRNSFWQMILTRQIEDEPPGSPPPAPQPEEPTPGPDPAISEAIRVLDEGRIPLGRLQMHDVPHLPLTLARIKSAGGSTEATSKALAELVDRDWTPELAHKIASTLATAERQATERSDVVALEALRLWTGLVTRFPPGPDERSAIGIYLFRGLGLILEAATPEHQPSLLTMVKKPDDPEPYALHGTQLLQEGELEGARRIFQTGLEVDARHPILRAGVERATTLIAKRQEMN